MAPKTFSPEAQTYVVGLDHEAEGYEARIRAAEAAGDDADKATAKRRLGEVQEELDRVLDTGDVTPKPPKGQPEDAERETPFEMAVQRRRRGGGGKRGGSGDGDVPTVKAVLEAVGDDAERAGEELAVELDRPNPRPTLVEALQRIRES